VNRPQFEQKKVLLAVFACLNYMLVLHWDTAIAFALDPNWDWDVCCGKVCDTTDWPQNKKQQTGDRPNIAAFYQAKAG
jgi:hypothetical protein